MIDHRHRSLQELIGKVIVNRLTELVVTRVFRYRDLDISLSFEANLIRNVELMIWNRGIRGVLLHLLVALLPNVVIKGRNSFLIGSYKCLSLEWFLCVFISIK